MLCLYLTPIHTGMTLSTKQPLPLEKWTDTVNFRDNNDLHTEQKHSKMIHQLKENKLLPRRAAGLFWSVPLLVMKFVWGAAFSAI